MAVGALGIAIAIAGVIAYTMRADLAALFLGARIWFGFPAAEIDALEVLAVTIQTIMTIVYGLFVAGVAFAVALRRYHKSTVAG